MANTYGDNDTRVCHDQCFFGPNAGPNSTAKYTWADPVTHFCTFNCTKNSFADNATAYCTNDCTIGTFADNSTWRCVTICPVNPLSFAYQATKKCIYQCPSPLFGNEDGRQCNEECPTSPFYYYKDYQNNRCAKSNYTLYYRLHISLLCWYFLSVLRHSLPIRILSKCCRAQVWKMSIILPLLRCCLKLYCMSKWIVYAQWIMLDKLSYFPSSLFWKRFIFCVRSYLHCPLLWIQKYWQMLNRMPINILFKFYNGNMWAMS